MKILITGTSGFVGKSLFELLSYNYPIQKISIRYQINQKIDIDFDGMIHLSGLAHDLNKKSNFNNYKESNYELTKQLFDIFLVSSGRDFIFMSSIKAVADQTKEVLSEIEGGNPSTYFGISKQLAENYILSKKIPNGKRVFILRPTMIHGPSNKGNLNLLYNFVIKGLPWPLGAFNNQRSFCSIDNVCYVVNQILEREDIPSGVYNLADDETLSTNELIELIAASTNRKARIFTISKKLINIIAKIGDILHLPLNTERLDKLTENFVVSNAKIKAALQIEKMPVSAKEGLTKTIKSFS